MSTGIDAKANATRGGGALEFLDLRLFEDGGVLVRRDAGGSAFALRGTAREAWGAIYGGLAVSEGAEGGTEGIAVGGQYIIQPCTASKSGCPNLGFVEIAGGTYDFSRGVTVTLSDFQVMRTQLTKEMYEGCYNDDRFCDAAPKSYGVDHPAHSLSWFDLQRYAEWAGVRLLTESEWEYVAKSQGESITYPWGDESPDCSYASFSRCEPSNTSKVCAKPKGNSSQGLCDLGGNVIEWVQDHYGSSTSLIGEDGAGACLDASGCPVNTSDGAKRVQRGGNWDSGARDLRAVDRYRDYPSNSGVGVGGRFAIAYLLSP